MPRLTPRLAFIALIAIAVLALACGGGDAQTRLAPYQTAAPPPERLRGVSLSPRSYQEPDFSDFLRLASRSGQVLEWVGDSAELEREDGGPAAVAGLAARSNLEAVYVASVYRQGEGRLLRPLDTANQAMYRDAAAAFARRHKPRYLGLGVEVNVMYEKSPAEFETFVQLFADTYDAVKAASPDTLLFTVFQLERMKGMQGGLFGGRNDPPWPSGSSSTASRRPTW